MYLKILWMYNDVMDLYGDKGNILALKYRCERRNIEFQLHKASINDTINFSEYDLVFIGGGADKEQRILSNDLIKRKSSIDRAIKNGVFFLLICGGYQLFGKYYIDAHNNKIQGLGIFDYYTESGKNGQRCIGDVIAKAKLDGEEITIVGFENHGGQTIKVDKPFAEVLYGNGNFFNSKYEGYYDKNILGTYIHGPLLPKNTRLADFIIKKSIEKRYKNIELSNLDDDIEDKACQDVIRRYIENGK